MRRRLASRATSTGSRPSVVLPSESRTMAEGGCFLPSLRSSSKRSRASARPSPVAVPPSATRSPIRVSTPSRSWLGRWAETTALEKLTAPTRRSSGTPARKVRAAFWAAEAAGVHVGGPHGARDVGHQHHRRLLLGHGHGGLGPRERNGQDGKGRREQR